MNVNKKIKADELLKQMNEILKFDSYEEKIDFKAVAIQLDILAEVSKVMEEKPITRKELADKLGKSKSFVSQLFSGDKMLNLKMIAQLQEILDMKFQSSFHKYSEFSKKINFSINDYQNEEYDSITPLIFDIKEGKTIPSSKAA